MIDIRNSNKLKHNSEFHLHFYLLLSLLLSNPMVYCPVPTSFLNKFHLVSAFIFFLPQFHSVFLSSSSHLLSFTFHPHLPACSLSSSLPSSFLSFSSSFLPVPTLFLLSLFSSQLLPHFFYSHLFFFCFHILSLVPAFSFRHQNFPPHPNHLTWQASVKLDVNQNLLQACFWTSDISST